MKLLRVLPILAHLGEGDSWMSLEPEPPQVASINEYIVLAVTMVCNLATEFLFCRYVVYRNSIDTNESAQKKKTVQQER